MPVKKPLSRRQAKRQRIAGTDARQTADSRRILRRLLRLEPDQIKLDLTLGELQIDLLKRVRDNLLSQP